jgi:hypothetical protein
MDFWYTYIIMCTETHSKEVTHEVQESASGD